MSPRTEQVSIYLRYISGGLTKETFIGYSLRPSKTGTAIVNYYFFSLAGPRDKQVVLAIRAKLGLTPQMDVRPYAYGTKHRTISKRIDCRLRKRTTELHGRVCRGNSIPYKNGNKMKRKEKMQHLGSPTYS